MNPLRLISFLAALVLCAGWGLLTLASYPFIVIADSDLGISAMERVGDFGMMFLLSLAAAAFQLIPWPRPRLALTMLVLALTLTCSFESDHTSEVARWPLTAVLGLALVAVFADFCRFLGTPLGGLGLFRLSLLVPALLVLTDFEGRVYRGNMPSSSRHREGILRAPHASVSLLEGEGLARAVSERTRLQATGDKEGTLVVKSLDGGPAFRLPAAEHDRMLQVLVFSSDGRMLAVADNNRRYTGSVITLWEVTPGGLETPPTVTLRHTLRGHTHWTFSLDFFPDGQTLLSANGDNTVRLWNVESGAELECFVPHAHTKWGWDTNADCVAAAPDGMTFATWANDGIKVWDRRSLRLVRKMRADDGIPCELAFTPDGETLIATDRECVRRWKLRPNPIFFFGLLGLLASGLVWLPWPRAASATGRSRRGLRP